MGRINAAILGGLAGLTFGVAVTLNDIADAHIREAESVSSGLEEHNEAYFLSIAFYGFSGALGFASYAEARRKEE